MSIRRPSGVTAIGILFLLSAGYLFVLGALMILTPGSISMARGAPLLFGLELAGPYMFVLTAGIGALIGSGLLNLSNLARWAATIVALAGIVMLMPSVSADVVTVQWNRLFFSGLAVVVRVMIVWYLFQHPVIEAFQKN
jgi:hypothetical protein